MPVGPPHVQEPIRVVHRQPHDRGGGVGVRVAARQPRRRRVAHAQRRVRIGQGLVGIERVEQLREGRAGGAVGCGLGRGRRGAAPVSPAVEFRFVNSAGGRGSCACTSRRQRHLRVAYHGLSRRQRAAGLGQQPSGDCAGCA